MGSFSLWLIIVLTTIIVSFSFVRRNFNHRPTKSVRGKYGYGIVEFTWTLSPFLFVIVSLVPTMYRIAAQRLKIDAVPRRLNIGFRIRPSDVRVFYRNCQELCGVNHSYMPIINVFTN